MKQVVIGVLALIAVSALLVGCGSSTGSSIPSSLAKTCAGDLKKVSGGGAIVRVGGNQCITADHGATVLASGNAVVSAHGNSVVDASGNVIIIVYNTDVRCLLRSKSITVINNIKTNFFNGQPVMSTSCKQVSLASASG